MSLLQPATTWSRYLLNAAIAAVIAALVINGLFAFATRMPSMLIDQDAGLTFLLAFAMACGAQSLLTAAAVSPAVRTGAITSVGCFAISSAVLSPLVPRHAVIDVQVGLIGVAAAIGLVVGMLSHRRASL